MPVDLTCSLVGLVVIIRCEFFLLPLPLAGALAVFLTAISLILYTRIRSKQAPTMCTWHLRVHGLPPRRRKTINLSGRRMEKAKSGRIKIRYREAKVFCARKMEEKQTVF
ncbi:MAG TPA: hypothetical protein VEF34_01315 [Syntrophobacteraceae bacterium]|nr:hypothetical protein [Syntrophobacteraceae bacterium]